MVFEIRTATPEDAAGPFVASVPAADRLPITSITRSWTSSTEPEALTATTRSEAMIAISS